LAYFLEFIYKTHYIFVNQKNKKILSFLEKSNLPLSTILDVRFSSLIYKTSFLTPPSQLLKIVHFYITNDFNGGFADVAPR